MPRLAANLSLMFTEWPFLERFQAAADAGFSAVEAQYPYDEPADAIAAALSRHDLTAVLFNLPADLPGGPGRGLAALPGRIQDFRDSLATALAYATACGVTRLHATAGLTHPDHASEHVFRDNLRFARDAAGAHGIAIVIEPLNRRDMPGYFLSDFGHAARIIEDVPGVKLLFDIYHRQILHGDVIEGLTALLPITGHVQIAAVPPRSEPGSGELDDFKILKTLDRLGYDGFVGCEYRPANGTLAGLGWMKALLDQG